MSWSKGEIALLIDTLRGNDCTKETQMAAASLIEELVERLAHSEDERFKSFESKHSRLG